MKVYFVRHGESEANVNREFSNREFKHPLTDTGRAQVAALAEQLKELPFQAIYSSPLLRARQTAEILSQQLGVTYYVVDALREHDVGELEGYSDPASWDRYEELIGEWFHKQDLDARIPGGESFNELRARFMPFIAELQEQYGATDDPVLLVGHGGLFHFMLPLLFSNVGFAFSGKHGLGNTACIIGEWQDEFWVCTKWGDTTLEPNPAG